MTLNNNATKFVKTEFYLHQKKQFQFRNKSAELGGDICATDSFQIGGIEYTVFMNGDAIGKSMQGAGERERFLELCKDYQGGGINFDPRVTKAIKKKMVFLAKMERS